MGEKGNNAAEDGGGICGFMAVVRVNGCVTRGRRKKGGKQGGAEAKRTMRVRILSRREITGPLVVSLSCS